jgi:metal-responsive CopG/Arc/MetJ family transcriptional regulator
VTYYRGTQEGKNRQRFGVCMKRELLERIDADARRQYMSRSVWLSSAAAEFLEQKEKEDRKRKK